MAIEFERQRSNMLYSWFSFFKDTQYVVGSDELTLEGHFAVGRENGLVKAPLEIEVGFPGDLVMLKKPTLAIAGDRMSPGFMSFGEVATEKTYELRAYGFVLGQGTERSNRLFRDRLMSDVEGLLEQASKTGIPLFESASKLALETSAEVLDYSVRTIPRTAPNVEADRFRFLVELTAAYASHT